MGEAIGKMAKLTVIVLNWNGEKLLKDCLSSISQQTYKDFDVLFVDNKSTDKSVHYVKKNYPNVKIIQNKKNEGFAEGNNIGIRKVESYYVLVLNNDTKLDIDCLKYLMAVVDSNPKLGMITPQMLYFDGKIDTFGLTAYKSGLTKDVKSDMDIFCPCGGAALYKKEMLEDIKLGDDYFDSDYFIYAEDYDLGFRARLRGWKCIHVPKAIVHHMHGATMKQSPLSVYLGDRNRLLTVIKNYPAPLLLRYSPMIIGLQLLTIAKYIFIHPLLILKSKLSALFLLPKMLKKRAIIQKGKKIKNVELMKLLK